MEKKRASQPRWLLPKSCTPVISFPRDQISFPQVSPFLLLSSRRPRSNVHLRSGFTKRCSTLNTSGVDSTWFHAFLINSLNQRVETIQGSSVLRLSIIQDVLMIALCSTTEICSSSSCWITCCLSLFLRARLFKRWTNSWWPPCESWLRRISSPIPGYGLSNALLLAHHFRRNLILLTGKRKLLLTKKRRKSRKTRMEMFWRVL